MATPIDRAVASIIKEIVRPFVSKHILRANKHRVKIAVKELVVDRFGGSTFDFIWICGCKDYINVPSEDKELLFGMVMNDVTRVVGHLDPAKIARGFGSILTKKEIERFDELRSDLVDIIVRYVTEMFYDEEF